MEKLKESKGLIALAAGALAVGYLIYKGSGSSGDKADDKESVADDRSERNAPAKDAPAEIEESKQEEEMENAYFLEEKDGPEQHKKIILDWVKEQVNSLLCENDDRKLSIVNRKLGESDFFRVMHIIMCY